MIPFAFRNVKDQKNTRNSPSYFDLVSNVVLENSRAAPAFNAAPRHEDI
jgi:hypothetical protein